MSIGKAEGYRGIWALSTVNAKGILRATHMTWIIVYGRQPIWVVYTVAGKFVRYAGSRRGVEKAFPSLVWRRWMVRWAMIDAHNYSIDKRRDTFSTLVRTEVPEELS